MQLPVAQLENLYRTLPRLECKGLCQECCGAIGMSPAEWGRMVEAGGRETPLPQVQADRTVRTADDPCRYLTTDGRCSVYDVRPMICRVWGLAEVMACPYGCVPEGGFLSDVDALALLQDAMIAGGGLGAPGHEVRKLFVANPTMLDGMLAFLREGMERDRAKQGQRGSAE